jgi:hypothetical protein
MFEMGNNCIAFLFSLIHRRLLCACVCVCAFRAGGRCLRYKTKGKHDER